MNNILQEAKIIDTVLNRLYPVGRSNAGIDHSRENNARHIAEITLDVCRKMLDSKSDEWRVPDETTPDKALVWRRAIYGGQVSWEYWSFGRLKEYVDVVLVKENQGPPPDDYRPKEKP